MCLLHKVQNTAVCSAVVFVVAAVAAAAAVVASVAVAAAAAFSRQILAYTVPCSCQRWVSASLAASHVAAAVRMTAGIEENYCCVGKGAVGVVGDWLDLDLEDTGFVREGIHNLKHKMMVD